MTNTKDKVKQGKHLTVTTRADGSVDLKWDWDALLAEVQSATADRKVHYVDVGDLSPDEATKLVKKVTKAVKAKKDLVKETEAKVTKTRAKATANKPAAKKTTTTKKSAK